MTPREGAGRRRIGPVRLRGALGTFPLWEVLQWLAGREEEGVLEIGGPADRAPRAWIHCRAGRVVAVGPARGGVGAPLGERLVREGALSRPRLRLALALQKRVPEAARPLGAWLLACRALPAEPLRRALRAQGRARLRRLLPRRRGWFRFRPGAPPAAGLPVGETIDRLLLESAHRLDEREA